MLLNDGRVVSNFIVRAIRGEPITVYRTGIQTRSFCNVDDPLQRRPVTALAQHELGWQPSIPLEQGLEPTITYFRKTLGQNATTRHQFFAG